MSSPEVPSWRIHDEGWLTYAECRTAGIDMVPGHSAGVRLAQKVCAACPVTVQCLAQADRVAREYGVGHAQGVWAGLTCRERTLRRTAGLQPVTCDGCGYICVPPARGVRRCARCTPRGSCEVRATLDALRGEIERLVALRQPLSRIAEQIGVSLSTLQRTCRQWGVVPTARGRKWRQDGLQPCGTIAARLRHTRAGLDYRTLDCACRNPIPRRAAAVAPPGDTT